MFAAIFWDNDGVLVDTEKYYFAANREVLLSVGIDLDLTTYCRVSLQQGASVLDLATSLNPDQMETLRLRRNEIYSDYLKTGDIIVPGLDKVLQKLHGKVKMGIVTSSKRSHFETCHARSALLQYFDFVLTREDYQLSKPHPDPYLKALTECRVDASRCLVVEDTPRGLLAARRAGLNCAVLPNPLLTSEAFPGAYRIMRNHSDILDLFPWIN